MVHLKCSYDYFEKKGLINQVKIIECPNCKKTLIPQEQVKEEKFQEVNIEKKDEKNPTQIAQNNPQIQASNVKTIRRAILEPKPEKNDSVEITPNANQNDPIKNEEEKKKKGEMEREAAKLQCEQIFKTNIEENKEILLLPEFNLDCLFNSNMNYLKQLYDDKYMKELFIEMINEFIQKNSKLEPSNLKNEIQEPIKEILKVEAKKEEDQKEIVKEQKDNLQIENKEEVIKEQKDQVIKEQKKDIVSSSRRTTKESKRIISKIF